MNMYSPVIRWVIAIFALLWQGYAYAVVLNVDSSGQLLGANAVDVNGMSYDVRFLDGSCDSLFNNCDTSAFVFHTFEDATAASQALIDQVFVDRFAQPYGNFDTEPFLTNGCEDYLYCKVLTAYDKDLYEDIPDVVYTVGILNTAYSQYAERIYSYTRLSTDDSATDLYPTMWVYAVWQPATSVSEPAPLALLAVGLVGLGINGRLRKQKLKG